MIGFTSTSLRDYSVKEVVDIAASANAEIIEWGSDVHIKTKKDAELAKALCAEKGIIINSYGTYYRTGSNDENGWKTICENASVMGAKYIRTWLGTKGSAETTEQEYKTLIDDARRCADYAKDFGLTVCFECHPNTYNDTTESSLRFMREVNRENIKTYYQSWYLDEKSDIEKLHKTFPYVQDVHISFSELRKFQMNGKKDEKFIDKILLNLKNLSFKNGILIEFTEDGKAENLIEDLKKLSFLMGKQ